MMKSLARYTSSDLSGLMERISRNSIGLDEYLDRFFNLNFYDTSSNYPPYNLVDVNNIESYLEIALAGFEKSEVHVYTEYGKLFVEGRKDSETETSNTYVYRGLATRSFKKSWILFDDTEVKSVEFNNGLLRIHLKKVIPEHHSRRDYL